MFGGSRGGFYFGRDRRFSSYGREQGSESKKLHGTR